MALVRSAAVERHHVIDVEPQTDLLARLDGMREEVRELSDFEEAVDGARREVEKAREAARAAAAALPWRPRRFRSVAW